MKLEIIGMSKVLGAIDKFQRNIHEDISHEIEGTAQRTVNSAKARLSPFGSEGEELVDQINKVRSSIDYKVEPQRLEAEVHAGGINPENMAAYLEFGTGKRAASYVPSLDPKYQALAMTFFVNGKGTLRTHRFLIPAYEQEKKRAVNRLKNLKVGW